MDRMEIIAFLKENLFVRVTHSLFSPEEYIYSGEDGNVYDENGYLFEDWYSIGLGRHAGIRDRSGSRWETGWSVAQGDAGK